MKLPPGVETDTFWVNNMAVDVLAPYITRTSAVMMYIMYRVPTGP